MTLLYSYSFNQFSIIHFTLAANYNMFSLLWQCLPKRHFCLSIWYHLKRDFYCFLLVRSLFFKERVMDTEWLLSHHPSGCHILLYHTSMFCYIIRPCSAISYFHVLLYHSSMFYYIILPCSAIAYFLLIGAYCWLTIRVSFIFHYQCHSKKEFHIPVPMSFEM